jgi:hypothetical protein
MKGRVMIEGDYTDTATGERFRAWRSVRGWRLALLVRAAAILSVSMNGALNAAGRAMMLAGALGLAVTMMSCGRTAAVASAVETRGVVASVANTGAGASSPVKAKEVHLCGAPTKAGGACRRRVRAEGMHCWMHGGPGAVEPSSK